MFTFCFLSVFFVIYFVLNTIIGVYLVYWNDLLSYIYFILLSLMNIEFSFGFTEFLFTLVCKNKDLPKLVNLRYQPRVALLYVTCNDFMPDLVQKLSGQTYENYEIFILDDSNNEEIKNVIDQYSINVIRRDSRKGNKAGNLNNWIAKYCNQQYQYFLVVDSDSILPTTFLEEMIKYAEHPKNSNVALFQSKIKIWNLKNKFARIISTANPLQISIWEKILSRSEMTPLGNNCLYRTDAIIKVGCFTEEFAAEDLATAIKLIEAGYGSKLVNIISYESVPESIKSYCKRNIRWSTQTLEVFLKRKCNIPILTKLYLLSFIYKTLSWFIISLLMSIAIWSYNTTLNDFYYFILLIFSGKFIYTSIFIPILIISMYWLYYLFGRIPLIMRSKINFFQFYKYLFLNLSIEFYALFPLLFSTLKTIFGKKVLFVVTDKRAIRHSVIDVLKDMKFSLIFIILLLFGVIRNPVSLIFNFIWFIPFVLTPLTIYKIQEK